MNNTGNRRRYSVDQGLIDGEIWKRTKFKGFQISNFARIKNATGVLHQSLMTKGYKRIKIGIKYYPIHRIVAIAFLPNKKNLPQVNHIDGNKLNNHVDNLEWCTLQDNMKHVGRLHLNPGAHGERNPKSLISDVVAKVLIRLWATTSITHSEISQLTGLSNKQLRKIKHCGRTHLDNYRNLFSNG